MPAAEKLAVPAPGAVAGMAATRPAHGRARGWRLGLAWLALALGGLFVPQLLSGFQLGLALQGVMLGIAAVGIGFLMHQCGLVMFGVAAFIGLPAYLVAIATLTLGWSPAGAVLAALAGSVLFALAVGALVVQARPLPFAMLTLALAQMLKSASTLQALRPLTGGEDGLSMIFEGTLFGLSGADMADPQRFWPVAWLALVAAVLVLWLAGRSRFGQVLRATKANEERMRFSGFDTYRPRLAAFVLSCAVVSVSGILMALHAAFASPELLDFVTGGNALVAMLVGGAGAVGGPLAGALLYTWAQDVFGATGHLELLTGLAVVAVLVFFPAGAAGFLTGLARRVRRAAARRGD